MRNRVLVLVLVFIASLAFGSKAGANTESGGQCREAEWYVNEGNKYLSDEPKKAELYYEEALKLCDDNANVYYDIGLARYLLRSVEPAAEALRKAIAIDRKHAAAYRLYAYILIKERIDREKGKIITDEFIGQSDADKEARMEIKLALIGEKTSTQFAKPLPLAAVAGKAFGRFVINDDNTVLDTKTGNMWEHKGYKRRARYSSATRYCRRLRLGGHEDWHLPTKMELFSLAAKEQEAPLFDNDAFPARPVGRYWTSHSNIPDANSSDIGIERVRKFDSTKLIFRATAVDVSNEEINDYDIGFSNYIFCVRHDEKRDE